MSQLDTRRNYGPKRDALRKQRRGKKVPGEGTTKTVTGTVTNVSKSRNGNEFVTVQTKTGDHARTQALIHAGVLPKLGMGGETKPRRKAAKGKRTKK